VAEVLLTNTTLQLIELQRHDGLSLASVQTLHDQLHGSVARGKSQKVICKWRSQLGQPCELQWWRERGERSGREWAKAEQEAQRVASLALKPRPGWPGSPVTFPE
jgi:hypothetical protein